MPETLYIIFFEKAAPYGGNFPLQKGAAWTRTFNACQQVVRIHDLAGNRRFASMEITLKFDPSKTAKTRERRAF